MAGLGASLGLRVTSDLQPTGGLGPRHGVLLLLSTGCLLYVVTPPVLGLITVCRSSEIWIPDLTVIQDLAEWLSWMTKCCVAPLVHCCICASCSGDKHDVGRKLKEEGKRRLNTSRCCMQTPGESDRFCPSDSHLTVFGIVSRRLM